MTCWAARKARYDADPVAREEFRQRRAKYRAKPQAQEKAKAALVRWRAKVMADPVRKARYRAMQCAAVRRYQARHIELTKARRAAWRAKNPERVKWHSSKRVGRQRPLSRQQLGPCPLLWGFPAYLVLDGRNK